jgi:hypothetical protein
VICADEFFLFGPFKRKSDGAPDPALVPLALGLAVNDKGSLLDEVPIGLAKVNNYKKNNKVKDEPVKPGVSTADQGCLRCHARAKGDPQETAPFPWYQ